MTDPNGASVRYVCGLHHVLLTGISAAGIQSTAAALLDLPSYPTWIAALCGVLFLVGRVNTRGLLTGDAPVAVAAARVVGE